MGLLDFLFDKEKKEQRRYEKLEKTLNEMYAQASERSYIIQQLRDLETEEAVRVLLTRFGKTAPNTTVDIDEKQQVYDTLVLLGHESNVDVVGTVKRHLLKAEGNINWPLKVLSDLLDYDEFKAFLVEMLGSCSTDYVQNPEKKQELILRAAEFKDPEVVREVSRFVDDLNETVRFLTVDTLLSQGHDELIEEPLRRMFPMEESLRIVNKLVEAFHDRPQWKIPEEEREAIEKVLPDQYGIHNKGHIYRHR